MTGPAAQRATAEGVLARTPFPHLLVYIADRLLSGSLRLVACGEGQPVEHVIYFVDGAPAKVRTGEPVAYLGRVLFEHGFIDEATLNRSLVDIAETRELHGEHLVRTGAISRSALLEALEAQAVRKLCHLFELPIETKFAFCADVNLLDGWGGPELIPLDPLPLIWSAVRTLPDERVVQATLARLGSATLRMHPDSDANRFGFDPAELAAVNLLRASPQTLDSLVACEVARDRAVRLVVYTLVVTRHIDHGGNAVPVGLTHAPAATGGSSSRIPTVAVARVRLSPRAGAAVGSAEGGDRALPGCEMQRGRAGGSLAADDPADLEAPETEHPPLAPDMRAAAPIVVPAVSTGTSAAKAIRDAGTETISADAGAVRRPSPSEPSAQPIELSPEMQARRTAIIERARSIDREDYFTMLGIERDADESKIQAAYFALAKTWHPDRVPPELGLVRFEASKVFARMNEAYEVLFDGTRRARYLEVLKGGTGTPEEAEKIQRIVTATADFQRAEVYYRKRDYVNALEHVKRAYEADPDQADYAALYALVLLAQRTSADDPLSDVGTMLEHAIEVEPRCERAYIARAQLRRRLGQLDGAIADFRHIAELNPKNVDAVREVRLHDMRNPKKARSRGSDKPSTRSSGRSRLSSSPAADAKGSGVFAGFQKLFKR